MVPDRDEVYVEWLAAAPKGVRWDKAQEMYALYQARRKEQAAAVARRLLGKTGNHTAWEMEPIGVGGKLEAVAAHHFCSEACRTEWIGISGFSGGMIMMKIGREDELTDGEVCDRCNSPLEGKTHGN